MKKTNRIFAAIAIIALLLLYILLLIFAFGASETSQGIFRALLATVFILPVLIYAFLLVARVVRPRQASPVKTLLVSPALQTEEALADYLATLGAQGFHCHYDNAYTAHEKGQVVLITDDATLCDTAKEEGYLAFLYENQTDLQEKLSAIGVR